MKKVASALLLLPLLGGCIGKSGPVEEYLRVGAGADCQQQAAPAKDRVVVAVRQFKAAESLDRQAVMVARGRVSSPSLRWYWEAAPGKLFEQAVVRGLNCAPGLAAAWPVRSNTEAGLSITGSVTVFEIQEQPLALNASAACQLWDGEGARMVDSRAFTASVPVKALDAQSIADAAAKALESMGSEAGSWAAAYGRNAQKAGPGK